MKKVEFYPTGKDYLCLPNKHIKTYIDGSCYEYSQTDEETKFMHLTYATGNGYNLLEEVHKYMNDHQEISERSIKNTFCRFISYLRYGSNDCNNSYLILEDHLTLDQSIELFLAELMIRFSYIEKEDEIIFTQTYHRWQSTDVLIRKHNHDDVLQMIIHPTEYKPITEEDIINENIWPKLADSYRKSDWYDENMQLVYPDEQERQIIEHFNENAAPQYRYILGAPAEPWRGNPLKARIIILSLNPGFIWGVNDKVKQNINIQLREGAMAELCRTIDLKSEGLLYQQDSYIKSHEEWTKKDSKEVKYGDVLNEIGDYYWFNNIEKLNIKKVNDFEFFKNFAIMQYCAYTSESFKDFPKNTILPSQKQTKDIIRHIVYNRKEVQFVIMRSWKKWQNLLDPDVWQMMQSRLIINKNRVQSLSEGNLGVENYKKLTDILNK